MSDGPIYDSDPEGAYGPPSGLPMPDSAALDDLRREVDELEGRITRAIHDAVDRATGTPSATGPDWQRALELRSDVEHQRTHYLTAVQVADLLGRDVGGLVANARRYGASWSQIGSALGITKQSAHERFPRADETARYLRETVAGRAPVVEIPNDLDDPLDPGPEPDREAEDVDRRRAAVQAWWDELDVVDRRRLLRHEAIDLLPEHLATGLAMHGVTVIPSGPSPVDGRPEGWFVPAVLEDFLAALRFR